MFGIGQAFTWIAEELSRQYSLGYYPRTTAQNGQRRAIKVKLSQAELIAKSRGSYIYTAKKGTDAQTTEKNQTDKKPYLSEGKRETIKIRPASP